MKLSIIIPIYNSEKYLKKTLESIQKQDFTDYECLLINDGSTDSSEKICNSFILKDSRFRIINTANKGVSSARNTGIINATGDYLTFVDSDDFIENNTYSEIFSYIDNEKLDICCFNFFYIDNNGNKTSGKFSIEKIDTCFIKYRVYMNSVWNKVFKRELFTNNNLLFDSEISNSEDLLLVFKLIHKAKKIKYITEPFYNYSYNSLSLTNTNLTQKKIDDRLLVSQKIIEYCKENNIEKEHIYLLKFLNAISCLPLITKKEFFNPKMFRKRIIKFNFWTYTKQPELFFIFLFAILHLDFICFMMVKTKSFIKKIMK